MLTSWFLMIVAWISQNAAAIVAIGLVFLAAALAFVISRNRHPDYECLYQGRWNRDD